MLKDLFGCPFPCVCVFIHACDYMSCVSPRRPQVEISYFLSFANLAFATGSFTEPRY